MCIRHLITKELPHTQVGGTLFLHGAFLKWATPISLLFSRIHQKPSSGLPPFMETPKKCPHRLRGAPPPPRPCRKSSPAAAAANGARRRRAASPPAGRSRSWRYVPGRWAGPNGAQRGLKRVRIGSGARKWG